MRKESNTNGNQNFMRFVPEIWALAFIGLFLNFSISGSSEDTPLVNNNPDEVAAHFESFRGLPAGTDTLGISWDRSKNQFTVTCLDQTP